MISHQITRNKIPAFDSGQLRFLGVWKVQFDKLQKRQFLGQAMTLWLFEAFAKFHMNLCWKLIYCNVLLNFFTPSAPIYY